MSNISRLSGMQFLKLLREEKGWSKYRAAQELGMLPQTYHHYESAAKGIKLAELVNIQKVFKISDKRLMTLIKDEYTKTSD